MSQNLKEEFQQLILKWSQNNLFDYPWRKNRTPYNVLISEILLIRTKATQIIPIYNKFMKIYPNLDAFIDIKLDIVENLIKSLGLLFRAKFLYEIA